MTKKSTWSGYRGKGKPVIPCVPECLNEKVETRGRMVQAPGDYKKRAPRRYASPYKQLKLLRNDLYLRVDQNHSLWDNPYYSHQAAQFGRKRVLVQEAFRESDLDLMLTYREHWERENLAGVREAALALREMGYEEVHGMVTEAHVQTVEKVAEAIRECFPLTPTIYSIAVRNPTYIPNGTYETAMIAMSGEVEEITVLNIIKQRGITDAKEIGKLVKEMLVESSALASGVL
jgi:hypothetical protein